MIIWPWKHGESVRICGHDQRRGRRVVAVDPKCRFQGCGDDLFLHLGLSKAQMLQGELLSASWNCWFLR